MSDTRLTAADLAATIGSRKARELLGIEPVGESTVRAPRKWRSDDCIGFVIPGPPIGAPRMTQRDKWKQRPCVVRYLEWKDLARQCAGELPPVEHIRSLSWIAYFVPPASWPKNKRSETIGELHRAKPDRDNIDKALLDALFDQDSGIADGRITKRWGHTARLEVTIEIRET